MITRATARRMLAEASEGEFAEATTQLLRVYGKVGQWLTVTEVAEMAGTSVRSFQRRLTQEGCVWSELLCQIRYELGIQLLTETDASLGEIAERLGYFNQSNFSRAFKRRINMTPDKYREQQNHKDTNS